MERTNTHSSDDDANPYELALARLSEIHGEVQHALDKMLERAGRLKVLEAGCGSASHLQFGPEVRITGIDVSQKALASNSILHETILGDIQTYRLPGSEFDFVSCWNVLEHLPKPRQAIMNLASCLKSGGLLVCAIPNVVSFEGLVTKLTPHWFHVLVYKHVFGRQDAGKDGHAPFRTYLRYSIAPRQLEKFAAGLGLETVYSRCYAVEPVMVFLKVHRRWGYWTYKTLARASQVLSMGTIHPYHAGYIVLFKKT